MAEQNCANCTIRGKYDTRPKSLIGRFWRWHINWCPGWKAYFTSLPQEEKKALSEKYSFEKYL